MSRLCRQLFPALVAMGKLEVGLLVMRFSHYPHRLSSEVRCPHG